jgi:hypothetical protein
MGMAGDPRRAAAFQDAMFVVLLISLVFATLGLALGIWYGDIFGCFVSIILAMGSTLSLWWVSRRRGTWSIRR